MRKFLLTAFISFSSLLVAQEDIKFYPEMSDPLQAVFCDYVNAEAEVRLLSSNSGMYVGNFINNRVYGWGRFVAENGSESYGQYRNGLHFFGITLTAETARVGSEEHFVEYDLATGNILRVKTHEGNLRLSAPYVPTPENPTPLYSFKMIKYENGDSYCGEVRDGRRHGYGLYFWANGDVWYGKYENGYRQGYGALYKTDNQIFSGKWIGDSKVE